MSASFRAAWEMGEGAGACSASTGSVTTLCLTWADLHLQRGAGRRPLPLMICTDAQVTCHRRETCQVHKMMLTFYSRNGSYKLDQHLKVRLSHVKIQISGLQDYALHTPRGGRPQMGWRSSIGVSGPPVVCTLELEGSGPGRQRAVQPRGAEWAEDLSRRTVS